MSMSLHKFCCVVVGSTLATTVLLAQSDPDAKDVEDVRAKLTQRAQRLVGDVYKSIKSEVIELVQKNGIERFSVSLQTGIEYAVIAACDFDCTRITMTLKDARGQVVAKSNEDAHTVLLHVTVPQTASFKAEVAVPGCKEEECYAGILLLAKNSERLSGAQPTGSPPSGSTATFTTHDNYDIDGSDINRLPEIALQECVAACRADPRCLAYSFDKWHRWCFLKDRADRFRLEPNTITGLLSSISKPPIVSAPVRMHHYANKAFAYGGEDSDKAESVDACEARCTQTTSCIAYTFFKQSKQCRLMQTVTGLPVADPKADSGAKRQESVAEEPSVVATTAPTVAPRPAGEAALRYVEREICESIITDTIKTTLPNTNPELTTAVVNECRKCFREALTSDFSPAELTALDALLLEKRLSTDGGTNAETKYAKVFSSCSDRTVIRAVEEVARGR
jgi:PAN domain-containing protein